MSTTTKNFHQPNQNKGNTQAARPTVPPKITTPGQGKAPCPCRPCTSKTRGAVQVTVTPTPSDNCGTPGRGILKKQRDKMSGLVRTNHTSNCTERRVATQNSFKKNCVPTKNQPAVQQHFDKKKNGPKVPIWNRNNYYNPRNDCNPDSFTTVSRYNDTSLLVNAPQYCS